MLDRLRPALYPATALAALVVGWWSYGVQGLLLAGGIVCFWLLLHFSRLMRLLRAAARRPVGHVSDARTLSLHLKTGMPLIEVVRRTHSLGLRRSEPDQEPQQLEWADERGYAVICTFLHSRLTAFELLAPAPAAPAATPGGPQGPARQP